ncbi:MAG: LamG domain-containing protein [Pseudomonadales bacterium]
MNALRALIMALLALAWASAQAADSSTACSLILDNGLTSHVPGVDIDFNEDAQLLNGSSTVLNFSDVDVDNGGARSCGAVHCSAGGGIGQTMDPGPFVDTTSGQNFTAPNDGTTLMLSDYRDVRVRSGTLRVNPAVTTYHLRRMRVDGGAVLELRAGDYWIDRVDLRDDSILRVVGSGTVRIFTNDLRIGQDVLINSPSRGSAGNPSSLFVWASNDFTIDSDTTFSGFLYGQGTVGFNEDVTMFGAVTAADDVTLEEDVTVTYDQAAVDAADFGCLCSCGPPLPVLDLAMNEPVWNGSPGEVVDQVAGNNGRAVNGALNQNVTPAIPGNPGTCRYGAFDGNDDYLAFADAAHLDLVSELTVALWINIRAIPGSGLKSFLSKDTNYEMHVDQNARLYWWWNDASGTTRSFTSTATVSANRWYHVAFTYRSGRQVMYLDGVDVGSTAFAGNLITNNLPLQIGQDQNFAGRHWNGLLDEVKIFDRALSATQVSTVMNQTRPCAAGVVGLDIDHDGAGIHCVDEPVRVRAITAGGATATGYAEQITLRTSTGRGSYALLAGNGVLDDPTPDDGVATYQFVAADNGTVTVALAYREGPALVDVDAEQTSNSTVRDDDSEGPIVFAPSGFTVTGNALPNPPPSPIVDPVPTQVAGAGFPVHVSAYGVTPDDPVCGVIESYGGARNLTFDMTYVNPNSGTRIATVDNQPVGTGTPQAVAFSSGQAVVTARYKDVGSIRLGVRDAASFPNVLQGGSNAFVVRPARLEISRIQSAAGIDNPQSATATGTRFVPAGEAFEVDVDVLDADDELTPNYGRETPAQGLRVVSEVLVVPGSGGRNGSTGDVLGGNLFAPVLPAGRFSNAQVVFDEVGAIRLRPAVDDADYLGSGPVPGVLSNPVGRFYPAAYDVLGASVTAACGTFTYMGQPALGLQYLLQALNVGGAVTENYDTGLLGAAATADPRLTAEAADDGVDRGARLGAVGATWVAGEVTLVRNDLVFARLGAPDGPFDPLDVGLAVDDLLDPVPLLGPDTDPAGSGNCAASSSCTAVSLGTTPVVYGRLAVLPAVGPENENLRVPLVAQIFTGAAFEAHGADNCSVYAATDVTLGGYTGNLEDGDTAVIGPVGGATLLGGAADPANPLELAAPDFGNDGTVDVSVDVDPWLEFDWQGTGLADPVGTAAFGRHRGHDRIIFWGEQR